MADNEQLTHNMLVSNLRELSHAVALSDLIKHKFVLLPKALPIDEENSKEMNNKILAGEFVEIWKEYDIVFLLHFIADMCE